VYLIIGDHIFLGNEDEKRNDAGLVILGHNEKYDNVCSFVGSNAGETLISTIMRKFSEESLDTIMPIEHLEHLLLHKSVIIT
jgi:hypothetical protein